MLYAVSTQLYPPLQITSSSSTQRGSPWFCLFAWLWQWGFCPSSSCSCLPIPLPPWTHRECHDPWRLIQTGLQTASEIQKLWERLTGQVIVTLRSSFLIWFPQIFLTGTFYVLNQTGKQLFYESAWKSLLHSETAAFDCFSVAGDGIWLSSLTASISWFFGVTLLECTCTHRAEVAKQFFLEDHPVLKMLGSSKVRDVLYRPSVFRYVGEIWILAIQCP